MRVSSSTINSMATNSMGNSYKTYMDIMNKRYLYLKEKLIELLAAHTGKNKEKIAQDTERNYFMTSYNAIEYGLIDKII